MIIGLAVIILTSIVNINFERINTAREIGEAGEAKMVGELLAEAINTVYSNGEGFSIYIGSGALNFTSISSSGMEGIGISLPILVDTSNKSLVIIKNSSRTGITMWNVSIPLIPSNITRMDPTSEHPSITIRNNGTHVIIYANQAYIRVI
jgi:hypothetical protein